MNKLEESPLPVKKMKTEKKKTSKKKRARRKLNRAKKEPQPAVGTPL
ncbi:hypothetical protein LBUL_1819 [Lactobacillus delbrueckii subsp. bulgaricus ATCC BAA-365]|nr:hypothetical protein LBUL_1819 [Lactobacillus delbrueckii subsp. bulgaricus ATCC BAA-365]ALT48230.1 hypothetical protein AT236_01904 [Lactobacillus delbrueckii subsp. bulgaricus]EHE87972.1 hypothetical protein LDBUL1632_01570 [Lactobacillus delbrueckii subsp. bulgaricus CNCM I-1632]